MIALNRRSGNICELRDFLCNGMRILFYICICIILPEMTAPTLAPRSSDRYSVLHTPYEGVVVRAHLAYPTKDEPRPWAYAMLGRLMLWAASPHPGLRPGTRMVGLRITCIG